MLRIKKNFKIKIGVYQLLKLQTQKHVDKRSVTALLMIAPKWKQPKCVSQVTRKKKKNLYNGTLPSNEKEQTANCHNEFGWILWALC